MSRRPPLFHLVLVAVSVASAGADTFWSPGPPAPYGKPLYGRMGQAMTYDSARGRTVVFGGTTDTQFTLYLDDTWESNGSTWTPGPTAPAGLTPRQGAAMAFDSLRGRVVLFGGDDGYYRADTWEYDGAAWSAGPAPPAGLDGRYGHAMVFDSSRAVMVMFGGGDNETWEYGGTSWNPGAAAPPALTARTEHGMAYDSVRQRTVLFGGYDGTLRKDTWEYSGSAWTPGPAAPPGLTPRSYVAMAYDRGRSRVVMFGGTLLPFGNPTGETWEYDGTGWTQGPSAPAGMVLRLDATIAYDSVRGRTVLFGGATSYFGRNDSWEYDGAAWTPGVPPPPVLDARGGHAMAFDPVRGKTLLFGGLTFQPYQYHNDVWELDGTAWTPGVYPAYVDGRAYTAMAFDGTGVTIFGGTQEYNPTFDDTWHYDGNTWTQGASGPSARLGHVMAFDNLRSRIVLFGGSYMNDTWEYDGATWFPGPSPPAGLTPRSATAMAFDSARGRAILFGGSGQPYSAFNETWEYDGSAWMPGVPAPSTLVGRFSHAMAYDSARAVVVMFGGNDGTILLGDTWEYDGAAGWAPAPIVSSSPAPRANHAMAFDSVRGKSVIYGGWIGYLSSAETWEYGGCPAMTVLPSVLRASTFGVPYVQPLTVVGGNAPHAFTVASGSLPGGVTLSGTGLLSGTPTDVGAFAFDVRVTDTYGCTADQQFMLQVGCATIGLSPPSLPGGIEGVPYAATITATGGQPPYVFTVAAGSLPPGLALQATGLLSGVPTTPGSYAFTVAVTDPNGCAGSISYALPITCGGITVLPASLPPGRANEPYYQVLGATGGTPPYSFTVSAGALPPGLGLSSSGVMSGTPTAGGSFTFGVRATDALACIGTRTYYVDVADPEDVVAGEGLGPPNASRVRVFTGAGASTTVDFVAYGVTGWGVNVASGDIDGGRAEILTGPGPGPAFGPQVRAWSATGSPMAKVNFFADGTLRYGVNVAAGRLDGDNYGELVTGPGPGEVFGPHVRGFDYDAIALSPIGKINFFAYATLKFGVNLTEGNVDGDAFDELVTGSGPSPVFAPHVRGFNYDGSSISPVGKISFNAFTAPEFGANVGSGDVEADGYDEILATPGPGAMLPSRFLGFDYDDASVVAMPGFDVTPFATLYGGRLGGGDLDADGRGDLLTGAGRDPAADSTVRSWTYDGVGLAARPGAFVPFAFETYGVNVAGGFLGW